MSSVQDTGCPADETHVTIRDRHAKLQAKGRLRAMGKPVQPNGILFTSMETASWH